MEKIKSVSYNWRQVGSTQDRDGAGEDWDRFTVGERGVILIEEFLSQGSGDLTNYLVHIEDKSSFRIFNPNFVEYFPYEEF